MSPMDVRMSTVASAVGAVVILLCFDDLDFAAIRAVTHNATAHDIKR